LQGCYFKDRSSGKAHSKVNDSASKEIISKNNLPKQDTSLSKPPECKKPKLDPVSTSRMGLQSPAKVKTAPRVFESDSDDDLFEAANELEDSFYEQQSPDNFSQNVLSSAGTKKTRKLFPGAKVGI
jgi:hypothetical protein